MNLDARLRKLESVYGDEDGYIVIWTGIRDNGVPENCVYLGKEYELVISTIDEAARRLTKRVNSPNRPLLFLLNKAKVQASAHTHQQTEVS
jgi:hypothetical protein